MSITQTFGPFDLLERISVGGMAEVFRARRRGQDQLVALKKILPAISEDDDFIRLFVDETRIASKLSHPNISKIFEVGQVDDGHYLAMELIEGKPLRTVMDRAKSKGHGLWIELIIPVMTQVAGALEYAHTLADGAGRPLGIVHRDVSPSNIMVSYAGDVKLIDFGIAKAAGKVTRTRAGAIKGKTGYMSPEQARGLPIDPRTDVFGLGICLWEALTLQRLFDGPNELVILEKVKTQTIPPPSQLNPQVPAELDQLTLKALAKNAEERYATARQFQAALQAFERSRQISNDPARIAGFMQSMFASEAAEAAPQHHREGQRMSDKGSDLDVFDGLAPKRSKPAPAPSRGAGPPGPPRQKTLLGLAAPPVSSRPSGPPGSRPHPPPPSPGPRSAPAPVPSRPPPPPPSGGRRPGGSLPPPPVPSSGRSAAPRPPGPPTPSRPPPPPASSAAPAPPPASAGGPPAPVDMDWDDEDEKTAVYDKGGHEDAAKALLRSAPPPAAGAPASGRVGAAAALASSGAASVPPPSLPRPPAVPASTPPPPMQAPAGSMAPAPTSGPPVSQAAPTLPASIPPPAPAPAGRTALIAVAALLAVGLIAALVVLMLPKSGTLLVTVAGPGNKPVDKVEVFVDGTKKCDTSPCKVTDLPAGSHMVHASADGYQSAAPQAISIESGAEAVMNLSLGQASEGTGLKVSAAGRGLRLSVDGEDKGPLPQDLTNMKPGLYTIKVAGNDSFEPYEEKHEVKENKVEKLELKLKVLKGLAKIKLGDNARGASVYLVTGGGERRRLTSFPIKLSIKTDKDYSIVANKRGFSEYKKDIVFEDGEAEKEFVIDMVEVGRDPPPPGPIAGPVKGPGPKPGPGPKKPDPPKPTAGGTGTVNVNSIPVSNVILNGRPLGTTPKTGVSVPAGPVTAVFVHPEHGRKSRSTVVKPGGTATLVVRFP